LLALQEPPDVRSSNVIAEPVQTIEGPDTELTVGNETTGTATIEVTVPQVLVFEYFIVSTPRAIPVTTPLPDTLAIEG
jgi:hypothetical protein